MVDSGLVPPPESVAQDEAILAAHIEGLVPDTLHFYRRSKPTISVGYFQRISESLDLEECRLRGVAIVRRKSGGSSIYTDQGQLIYALALHEEDVSKDRAESFKVICSAIAAALSSLGVDARYRPLNDIEVAGKKVSGNAQLRRKGSVLQHGTVVLETDLSEMDAVLKTKFSKSRGVAKPSDRVTSLSALLGEKVSVESLKEAIVKHFEDAFSVVIERGTLTEWERNRVAHLVEEHYSRDEWNLKF